MDTISESSPATQQGGASGGDEQTQATAIGRILDVVRDEVRSFGAKGSKTDERADFPAFQHVLEAGDNRHRSGANLIIYHRVWRKSGSRDSFYAWLNYREGRLLDLPQCSRLDLESQLVEEPDYVTFFLQEGNRKKELQVPLLGRRQANWAAVETVFGGPLKVVWPDRPASAPGVEPYGLTSDAFRQKEYEVERVRQELPSPATVEQEEENASVLSKLFVRVKRTFSESLSRTSSTASPNVPGSSRTVSEFLEQWREGQEGQSPKTSRDRANDQIWRRNYSNEKVEPEVTRPHED